MIKVFDYWNSLCISKQPRLKSYENTKKGIEDPSDFGRASLVHLLLVCCNHFSESFRGMEHWYDNIRSVYISLLELTVKLKGLENVESYDSLQVLNNDDDLLQAQRIHVDFGAESEIKRLLQTKQMIIISLFEMWYLLLQYNVLVFNFSLYLH